MQNTTSKNKNMDNKESSVGNSNVALQVGEHSGASSAHQAGSVHTGADKTDRLTKQSGAPTSSSGMDVHSGAKQTAEQPVSKISGSQKRKRRRNKGRLPTDGHSGTNTSDGDQTRQADGTRKRDRSKGSTPQEGKAQKRRATYAGVLSYSRAAAAELKVGIVPQGFPDDTIRDDQVRPLEEAIIERIVAAEEGPAPCFENRWLSHGVLMVHCATTNDKEWLKTNISSLKPWEGAVLRVIDSDQIPKWKKVIIYVEAGKSAKNILRTLSVQNGNLNALKWKEIEFRADAGKGGSSLLVSMPEEQLQALERVNLRPLYGLGRAHCVKLRDALVVPMAQEDIPPNSEAESTLESEETKLHTAEEMEGISEDTVPLPIGPHIVDLSSSLEEVTISGGGAGTQVGAQGQVSQLMSHNTELPQ